MTTFSMSAAARRLRLSKPTVRKKIENGEIAAKQLPDGSFEIDGAELARFEASYRKPARGQKIAEPEPDKDETTRLAILEVELRHARERIADLERREDQARQEAAQARQNERDAMVRVAALIEDRAKGQGLLARVFGFTGNKGS